MAVVMTIGQYSDCCVGCLMVLTKEYMYISDRRVSSPPLSLSVGSTLPTSLCLLCRHSAVIQTDKYCRYCRQSREGLGECFLRTTKGGADPSITDIYSLVLTDIIVVAEVLMVWSFRS